MKRNLFLLLLLVAIAGCQRDQTPTTPQETVTPIPSPPKTSTSPAKSESLPQLLQQMGQLKLDSAEGLKRGEILFRKIIKLDDKNEKALEGLSYIMSVKNDFTDGLPLIQKCLQLNPRNENCQHALYLFYSQKNDLINVDKVTAACLQLLPKSTLCIRDRGIYELSQKNYENALNLFTQIKLMHETGEKKISDISTIYYSIGLTYEVMGKKNEAKDYYQKACTGQHTLACEKIRSN